MAAESACPQRRAVPKSLTEMGFRVVTVMLIKFGIVRFWANRLQRYIKAANPPNLKTLIIYKSSILAHFAIFVHDKVFTFYFRTNFFPKYLAVWKEMLTFATS